MRTISALRGLTVWIVLVLMFVLTPVASRAADDTILTVTGRHAQTGAEVTIDLSLAEIAAMESSVLETTTIWTSGEIAFRGVLLQDLFRFLDLELPLRVRCTALNEYRIEIPLSDTRETTVLVAYQQDGSYMRVRDKGPLWIIYPRESGIINAADRMIWQLRHMESVY